MANTFTVLRGAGAPLLESNLSTNTISVQKAHGAGGIEEGLTRDDLFSALRFDAAGKEIASFVLNRPEFREAKFLLTV
jgi:3-isopropylmalate dehydratase small subunit